MLKRTRYFITGTVQGVGFRPAIYRLARAAGLTGSVHNSPAGVTIEVQGSQSLLGRFEKDIARAENLPELADIKSIVATDAQVLADESSFVISPSSVAGDKDAAVPADAAVCRQCLVEMYTRADFRHNYAFINCTNCGPRYSIIKTIPYDRPNTTMACFEMCRRCSGQYLDPGDRRFHAQPVACPRCGPALGLLDDQGAVLESDADKAVDRAALLLKSGKIVAIKGIGGFHLAVDAANEEAVARLRRRKRRDHKPFAVMVGDIETARQFAQVGKAEAQLLGRAEAPIVLLGKKNTDMIADSVARGTDTFGVILCYAPVHYLLFDKGPAVLVMTSANVSDEPLICDNGRAIDELGPIADAFLTHNRDIYRRVDDSVVQLIADEPALVRRARGYVPRPIHMTRPSKRHILATGSDLKNTFCFARGNQLILSEHIGDLAGPRVYRHYVESIEHLAGLFEMEPEMVVCDAHPGYFSTQYAKSLQAERLIEVQHHWAHVGSVLAEHRHEGPVIGVVCDGTGYGTDGAIWGCELLRADLSSFERLGHLDYFELPGGDAGSKEAIRCVMGLLWQVCGDDLETEFGDLLGSIEPDAQKRRVILSQLQSGLNTVKTSSLGRVFDAAAALAKLGRYNHFEAQLPMALQSIADRDVKQGYDFEIRRGLLDLRPAVGQMALDSISGAEPGLISAKFHNCLIEGLSSWAGQGAKRAGIKDIALGGGVFCNRLLAEGVIAALQGRGFNVLWNRNAPANDGSIALGQGAIGARICDDM